MTPDEVRMLDNQFSILFIRGERLVKDLKYDILKHPNVGMTADGIADAYIHGSSDKAIGTITLSRELAELSPPAGSADGNDTYELLSEDEVEKMIEKELTE